MVSSIVANSTGGNFGAFLCLLVEVIVWRQELQESTNL